MKRCKHLVTSWTPAPDDLERADGFDWDHRTKERCVSCGHLLPLGPAADSPAALCELRAAEIAAAVMDLSKSTKPDPRVSDVATRAEVEGWVAAWSWSELQLSTNDEHAGYLARLIYEHKEEA